MRNHNKYWFKRRRYGYGWRPISWQGWTSIGLYLVVVVAGAWTIRDVPQGQFTREIGAYLLVVTVATAGLLRVAYRHGPRPKWRWGKRDDDDPKFDL